MQICLHDISKDMYNHLIVFLYRSAELLFDS